MYIFTEVSNIRCFNATTKTYTCSRCCVNVALAGGTFVSRTDQDVTYFTVTNVEGDGNCLMRVYALCCAPEMLLVSTDVTT